MLFETKLTQIIYSKWTLTPRRCMFLCYQVMRIFLSLAAGSENDMNYVELPIDVNVETSLNEIDGRPTADEMVRIRIKTIVLK